MSHKYDAMRVCISCVRPRNNKYTGNTLLTYLITILIIVALQAQTRNNSSRSLRCARENMQQDFGFVHFAKMDVEKCGALVDEGAGKIIFWGLDFLVHKSTCRHERGEIRQSVAILCRGVHKHGRGQGQGGGWKG